MKRFILFSLFALLLTSCAGANSANTQSSAPSTSAPKTALAPIQIENVYNDCEFTLKEFPNVSLRIGPRILNDEGSLYVRPLYVNDVRVTENTIDRLLFAYDVNKDGYRDLVFSETIDNNRTAHINGFDIHNMKKMVNNLGLRQYRMDLKIEEGRLRARAYVASTSNSITFDYAEIAYSDEKGLYFIWDNMYQFKDFKLNRITLDDENKTLVSPTTNESGSSYQLNANTDYIFEIAAPREEKPTLELNDFFRQTGLDVRVGDEVLGVNKFEPLTSENDIHKARINFMNRVKEFIYTFVIPGMSFSVNISIID